MRNRLFTLTLVILLMIPATLTARSLLNVSLGVGATYSPEQDSDISIGFEDPDNWMFSGEISARLAFLQGQAMVYPVTCADDAQGVLLIGMGSFSLPVVGSLLAVEVGAGPSVTYMPTSSDESRSFYELANGTHADAEEKTFTEAMLESPLYLQIGVGSEIGPVGLKVRYLLKSSETLGSVLSSSEWWGAFAVDKASLSLALALKMF
ncbi:MAG: hypothetical protein AB7D92_06480 [Sphaerochaeta sp.]